MMRMRNAGEAAVNCEILEPQTLLRHYVMSSRPIFPTQGSMHRRQAMDRGQVVRSDRQEMLCEYQLVKCKLTRLQHE